MIISKNLLRNELLLNSMDQSYLGVKLSEQLVQTSWPKLLRRSNDPDSSSRVKGKSTLAGNMEVELPIQKIIYVSNMSSTIKL